MINGGAEMSMWTAIVLIVIAAMAGQAWRHHVKARGSNTDREALDDLHQRIDSLENDLRNRVETLERIVTDDKDDLKRQFDHLDKAG
jgi:sensor domain CHASE-containing protein